MLARIRAQLLDWKQLIRMIVANVIYEIASALCQFADNLAPNLDTETEYEP